MTPATIPHRRALQRWVARQPDDTPKFAAVTAYCALRCITEGRSSPAVMEALAESVAKMGEA